MRAAASCLLAATHLLSFTFFDFADTSLLLLFRKYTYGFDLSVRSKEADPA